MRKLKKNNKAQYNNKKEINKEEGVKVVCGVNNTFEPRPDPKTTTGSASHQKTASSAIPETKTKMDANIELHSMAAVADSNQN